MAGDDRFGVRPFWSKRRLLKDLVSMHVESCGESAPPLERVKSKYLAVSPATDNLSIKDVVAIKNILISISKLKTCG